MEFGELDIDQRIKKGLRESGLEWMTEIQERVIPVALAGEDVIGSSQTGTGKTLAFVVPVLQRLVDLRWNAEDGLGALVLTPTRELALQIFDVLGGVGRHTGLSMGLVMGGLESEDEEARIARMNVVVCTPGRILQHLQENAQFDAGRVQILVLDEADKMVEMGFKEMLGDILEYIPRERQVLLFSATPKASTTRILRLEDPRVVSMYKEEGFPSKLRQFFHMMRIEDKISHLHAFVERSASAKAIVFFSTCKEVKFHYLLFAKLRAAARIFCLNGGMTQAQRIDTFRRFVKEKSGILFCTDVASRGLDFPKVDVVVQYDCPCNVETYVHRVGRTARNDEEGESHLYLVHGEEALLSDIQKKKWTMQKETGIRNEILEGARAHVRSMGSRVKAAVKSNKELREYCEKYLRTYEKFLAFSSKKYSSGTIRKIDALYDSFGIVREKIQTQ